MNDCKYCEHGVDHTIAACASFSKKVEETNVISGFRGDYRFLSNFFPVVVEYDGALYPSVENAYQAAKTFDLVLRTNFVSISASKSKRMGRLLQLRPDWEDVKLSVMENLLRQKFKTGSNLRSMLMATSGKQIIEGNDWCDNFWGSCNCTNCKSDGQNHLGKLLMKIRDE